MPAIFIYHWGMPLKIMGIVNVTPDSFSRDGRLQNHRSVQSHLQYALDLIGQGADIIDIGGESTRPGARPVALHEELRRVIPVIKLLSAQSSVPISVDTINPKSQRLL